jgi:hypothetical protein
VRLTGMAAAYRLDNLFADGAVLVKEVLAGEHGRMTTGQANWACNQDCALCLEAL